ncbi:DUF5336 domain-containing protein [Rhodococcus sp. 3Y1]
MNRECFTSVSTTWSAPGARVKGICPLSPVGVSVRSRDTYAGNHRRPSTRRSHDVHAARAQLRATESAGSGRWNQESRIHPAHRRRGTRPDQFPARFAPFTSISGSSSGIGSGLDTSSSFFESSIYGLGFVFAGGVVAGVSLLPKQSYAGIAAALTLTGFFALVFAAFSVGTSDYVDISLGWGLIIVLILSFVQTVVAVAALLFEIGILKAPAPRPVAQQYGQQQPYGQAPGQAPGQPQGYGQAQYGQPQQAQQPGQYQQNPQYGQAQQQGYGGAHAAPSTRPLRSRLTARLRLPTGRTRCKIPDRPTRRPRRRRLTIR